MEGKGLDLFGDRGGSLSRGLWVDRRRRVVALRTCFLVNWCIQKQEWYEYTTALVLKEG